MHNRLFKKEDKPNQDEKTSLVSTLDDNLYIKLKKIFERIDNLHLKNDTNHLKDFIKTKQNPYQAECFLTALGWEVDKLKRNNENSLEETLKICCEILCCCLILTKGSPIDKFQMMTNQPRVNNNNQADPLMVELSQSIWIFVNELKQGNKTIDNLSDYLEKYENQKSEYGKPPEWMRMI